MFKHAINVHTKTIHAFSRFYIRGAFTEYESKVNDCIFQARIPKIFAESDVNMGNILLYDLKIKYFSCHYDILL